jgi:hypothetical protein
MARLKRILKTVVMKYISSDIPAKSVKRNVSIISYPKYMNSTKIIKDAASHAHFLALTGARFH